MQRYTVRIQKSLEFLKTVNGIDKDLVVILWLNVSGGGVSMIEFVLDWETKYNIFMVSCSYCALVLTQNQIYSGKYVGESIMISS